jgi:cation:H+ antiporter
MLWFEGLPLAGNLALFAAGAVAIWVAGTRLAGYADAIAERTGIGRAWIGALLLGGITSLPEGATTVTASAIGNAPLAVNNLLGGVAMQVALLAVADAIVPGRALAARPRDPAVLLQGVILIVVLALAAGGIVAGEVAVLGVGAWTAAIAGTAVFGFWLIHADGRRDTWEPVAFREDGAERVDEKAAGAGAGGGARALPGGRLYAYTVAAGAAILLAGYVVSRTGDALAEQTGIGASFVGVLLVAVATSLPEASTTIAAVRMGEYELAFANIFGANILDVSILLLADLVFTGGPVLGEVGAFSALGAVLGIVLTGVYLVAVLQRRRRVVLGMGIGSIVVLLLYLGGMGLLWTLR